MSQFGPLISASWDKDPRHVVFWLAKMKFVAKMLAGKANVLEVGCGDASGSRIVAQAVGKLTGIDTDWELLDRSPSKDRMNLYQHDIMRQPVYETFDAAFALDVLDHVPVEQEDIFFENVKASLNKNGVLIVGSPAKEGRGYTTGDPHAACEFKGSIHCTPVVNCKTEQEMRASFARHFSNVFLFGMNDEVVHCGYGAMCHYRLAMGVL